MHTLLVLRAAVLVPRVVPVLRVVVSLHAVLQALLMVHVSRAALCWFGVWQLWRQAARVAVQECVKLLCESS